MWLLIAFIAVPLIEITLFIQVGGTIGLWSTLLFVVITAILGTYLVRQQGMIALQNIQRSFSGLEDPSEALAHGAMILFSGALLLTPGFFTDGIGFALLIPQIRLAVFHWMRKRMKIGGFSVQGTRQQQNQDDVIDGEFSEVYTSQKKVRSPSGWTE